MTKELHQINYSANSSESIARCIYIGALAGHELGAWSSPKMMQRYISITPENLKELRKFGY